MKTKLLLVFVVVFGSAVSAPTWSAESDETAAFVDLMSNYLDVSRKLVELVQSPEGASYLAVEGIFEIYEQQKDAPSAIEHYERLLRETQGNQAIRNIIRLKLRDIYKETSRPKKALEQLDLILVENLNG